MKKLFLLVDVLVCPTAPTTAFKAGEKFNDPLSMYLSDLMTIPVNLAGLPALSLPCGFDDKGLPVGIQLIANVLQESRLFQVAHAYEQFYELALAPPRIALIFEIRRNRAAEVSNAIIG